MGNFINPYTFFPVSEGKRRHHSEYFIDPEGTVSGVINCKLRTRSQLTICDKISEHDFDFYKVGNTPMIPGSSLRGTFRSVFEALTDSCFSSTNAEDSDFFSSRQDKRETGLLGKVGDKYYLYPAIRHKDENNERLGNYKEGQEVRFSASKIGDISYIQQVGGSCSTVGYVHKVNRMNNTRFDKKTGEKKRVCNFDSIFQKAPSQPEVIQNDFIERLEVNIRMSIEGTNDTKLIPALKNYLALLKDMKAGSALLPVWYTKSGGNYYFSHAQKSRSVFYKKPIDLLKEHTLDKCSDINKLCEACALFGTIGEGDDGIIISSRLRFGDAVCQTPEKMGGRFLLPVLGQPRLSSFEFYLNMPEGTKNVDDSGVTIAGRKFYWHNIKNPITKDAEMVSQDMQNTAQLMEKDSVFTFPVYFDNITMSQLRKLIFVLNLGENDLDSKHCHKVGHGKPIGLGSAKIICESIRIRRFDGTSYTEEDFSKLAGEDNSKEFANSKNVDRILKVTDLDAVDSNLVSYPYTDESSDIFKWFSDNRFKCDPFNKHLPSLDAESQTLPTNPKPDKSGGHRGGYGGGGRYNGGRNNDRRNNSSPDTGGRFSSGSGGGNSLGSIMRRKGK